MKTQAQYNALLDSFIKDYAGYYVDYYGYAGECISLCKRWLDSIHNGKVGGAMGAPATAHGAGSDYWNSPPSEVLQYFNKEEWNPSKTYPKGSMIVYTHTSHIGIYLCKGRTGYTSVFEQNADPDGSPSGTHQRLNSHINGILVLKVAAPAVTSSYRVVPGDNLSKIAARFHTTIAQLVSWNKAKYPTLVKHPDDIDIGWVLKVK